MSKTKIFLLGLLAMLTLTSCGDVSPNRFPTSEEDASQQEEKIIEQILSSTSVDSTVSEVEDLPDIDTDNLIAPPEGVDTSSIETDKDFVICLRGKDDVAPAAPMAFKPTLEAKRADFRIEDHNGYEIPAVETTKEGYPGFTAADGFEGSDLYRITLLNDNASFLGKDNCVREIFLNLHQGPQTPEENVENRKIKDNIQLFDSDDIVEEDDDALGNYFVYPTPIDLQKGDIFGMGHDAGHPEDSNGFYGEFVSCTRNPNGDGYLVRYNDAQGDDIYDELEIDRCDETVDLDNARPIIDADEIAEAILDTDQAYAAAAACYRQAKRLNSLIPDGGSWLTRLTLDIKTSYANDTFKLSIIGSLNFQPATHVCIQLVFEISVQTTWKAKGSAGLEWKFIVPVGIKYEVYVTRDTTFFIDLKLIVSYSNTAPTDKEIDDQISKEYLSALDSKHQADEHCPITAGGAKGVTGKDKKSLQLFEIDYNGFFPLQIRFDVSLYLVTSLQASVAVNYTYRSKDVVLNYSSESSGSDSGASREECESTSEFSLTFYGSIYFEVGLEVSLGIGVAGLYKYLHIRVYADIFVNLTIQGYIRLRLVYSAGSWDGDVSLGGKIEIGWGARLGIEIKAFFFDYEHTWPITNAVIWGIGNMHAINKFSQVDQTVELTKNETDVTALDILRMEIFDGDTMSTAVQSYPITTVIHYMYGITVDEGKYNLPIYKVSVTEHPEWIEIKDGKIVLTEEAPAEFDAKFTLTVPSYLGDAGTKTVTVNFKASETQNVFLDGVLYGHYRDGQALHFPACTTVKDHKKFLGYQVGSDPVIYQPGDKVNIVYSAENKNTYITSLWREYITYQVNFFDMKGNLLKSEDVEKGYAATPPEGEERDRYMGENFLFRAWSTEEYKNVQCNLAVVALYDEISLT